MMKVKYIQMYNEFMKWLYMYAESVRILAKGYLPILLVAPLKLKELLDTVRTTI